MPRWFVAVGVATVLAAGAFAWSRITPDMSMFGRMLPQPAASVDQASVPSAANPSSAGAVEQALPRESERTAAPQPVGTTNDVVATDDRAEAQAAVLRRMQNQIVERDERLARARRNVSVEMYSTAWCRVCKDARQYMNEAGVSFEEYDVDKDRDADRRLRSINPQHTVPTFDIDGAVLTGFSPAAFESMLTSAAGRRAARTE